jgi:nucleoid DNA-binding protein
MDQVSQEIPKEIESHLERILGASQEEWSKEEGALEKLKTVWLKKDSLFDEQIALLGMEKVNFLDRTDPRGMLLLSFSGSLVSLGYGSERWVEYASIKFRSDVPDIIRCDKTSLAEDLHTGKIAQFTAGSLKKTSALFKIVVCKEDVPPSEQEKRIREATVYLTNSFVHMNRDLTLPLGGEELDQFNKKNIIAYLARKNGLSQEKMRGIIDDYTYMLETGMLLGKTVSLGRIGRLSLKLKPRRKARLGRNLQTGEEITIPAKEAHFGPVFKYSSTVKERAARIPAPEDGQEEEE